MPVSEYPSSDEIMQNERQSQQATQEQAQKAIDPNSILSAIQQLAQFVNVIAQTKPEVGAQLKQLFGDFMKLTQEALSPQAQAPAPAPQPQASPAPIPQAPTPAPAPEAPAPIGPGQGQGPRDGTGPRAQMEGRAPAPEAPAPEIVPSREAQPAPRGSRPVGMTKTSRPLHPARVAV